MTNLYSEMRDQPARLSTPERALAVGAHPDDVEFGAGGTLAKWARDGCEVIIAVVTDGSKGTWDPARDPSELIADRRREQGLAAEVLGAADVVHFAYVDGELEYTMELRGQMCRLIREVRPEVVLGHDPWRPYMLHPDHRAAGWAIVDGVVAARDHLFFPEQRLAPHRPDALLLWAAGEADHWEDIAATIDTKVDALLCHSSQGETTMAGADQGADRADAFRRRITEWAARNGEAAGLAAAEAFKRIKP